MKQAGTVESDGGLVLIRCCGSFIPEMPAELRIKLVEDIWDTLPKLQCKFDLRHYNTLLKIHLENECKFDPLQFLDSMKEQKLKPNKVTYQRLFSHYCQEGDIEGAQNILKLMKYERFPVSEQIYNDLIIGQAHAKDMQSAREIVDMMKESDIPPTLATYTSLACGYAIMGDIDNVLFTIQESEANDFLMRDKDLLLIIYTLIVNNHEELIEQILPRLCCDIRYNNDCMRVILELVNRGYHQPAFTLLNTMQNQKLMYDKAVSYELLFIRQIVQQGVPLNLVVHYCSKLQGGLEELALLKATETSLLHQRPDDGVSFLKELHAKGFKLRTHFFWPAILCHKGNDSGIHDTLKLMLDLNCPPDFNTFMNNVFPILTVNEPFAVVLKLKNMGYEVTDVINPLCAFLIQKGDVETAAKLLTVYPVNCVITSLHLNILIHGYVKSKDVNSTMKILQHSQQNPKLLTNTKPEDDVFGKFILNLIRTTGCDVPLLESFLISMEEKKLRISNSAHEAVSRNLYDLSGTRITSILPKLVSTEITPLKEEEASIGYKVPDNMCVEELEAYLIQRKAKGLRTTEVLHKLLMLHSRNKDLDRVKEILEELDDVSFIYRGNTYSVLMELFCQHGDIEAAMNYKRLLDSEFPRFKIDFFKILNLATLLASHKKYDDAEKVISSYISTFGAGSGKSSTFDKNIFKLLDTIASSEDVNKAREILKLLEDWGYCTPTNTILGPLVKAHILRNDLHGAINEFERIVKAYHKTPWSNELMKALIQAGDSQTLQKVVHTVSTVHGKENMVIDLAKAFIEGGQSHKAVKLFQMPNFKFNGSRLNTFCEYFVNKNQVENLESLLMVTKDVQGVDRDYMYYQLITAYVNAENVEKVLGVWNMMEEEDFVCSKSTLHLLGSFLKQKNQPVPFSFPQENVVIKRQRSSDLVTEISNLIDSSLKENKLSEAVKLSEKLYLSNLYPIPQVAQQFALKLSEANDVRNLIKLHKSLPVNIARKIYFSSYLTSCFMKKDCAEEFLNIFETQTYKNEDNLLHAGILSLLFVRPELLDRVRRLADIYYEEGVPYLRKVLWVYYMKTKLFDEANQIIKSTPEMQSHLYISSLLKHVRQSNDIEISQKLLEVVMNSKLSNRIKGIVFSAHINVLLSVQNVEEALKVFKESQNAVKLEDLNRGTLVRLKEHLDIARMAVPFQVPAYISSQRDSTRNEGIFEDW